jgi:hypothetical protein
MNKTMLDRPQTADSYSVGFKISLHSDPKLTCTEFQYTRDLFYVQILKML